MNFREMMALLVLYDAAPEIARIIATRLMPELTEFDGSAYDALKERYRNEAVGEVNQRRK